MLEFLINFDEALFFLINGLPHNQLSNTIFLIFSFYPLIIWFALGMLILWYEKRSLWIMVRLGFALFLAAFMTSVIIKPIVARPRPDILFKNKVIGIEEQPSLYSESNDYAFPSGHAAMAFAGAYILTKKEKRKNKKFLPIILYVIAGLTAFSRIYLGKHYPFDVVAGALLGVFIASIAWKIVDFFHPPEVVTSQKNHSF